MANTREAEELAERKLTEATREIERTEHHHPKEYEYSVDGIGYKSHEMALAETITKIVDGHLNTEIDEILPWSYAAPAALKDGA